MSFNLIIIKQGSYAGRTSHEILEAVMSLALFEVPHKVVFFNHGLSWLTNNQDAGVHKSLAKQLKALPMYGSEELYFVEEHRHLLGEQWAPNSIEPTSLTQLATWFQQANHVEVF